MAVLETRRFPDGESYVRIGSDVAGRRVLAVCSLAGPDEQFLPLVFAAGVARELGAARVDLVAPYLAYMRQDARFRPGEAVTSRQFAKLVSREFDGLVTVDPHLHRHASLDEIYAIPAIAARAAPLLAAWIAENVERALIVGPDSESEQWAAEVAALAGAPHVVLEKSRHGDRDVSIEVPDLGAWRDRQPVLIDDIVSSGQTVIEAAAGIVRQRLAPPVCLAVHALLDAEVGRRLARATRAVVSTDTVPHPSNGIAVVTLLADAVRSLAPRAPIS